MFTQSVKTLSTITGIVAMLTLALSSAHGESPSKNGSHEAAARKIYNETQSKLTSYKKVTAQYEDDPLVFELTGWYDGTTLRKITSILPGEDGGGYEEYFFDENGTLCFVYNTYTEIGENDREVAIKNRFYFDTKSGTMTWKMEGRANHVISSEDRKAETERLTGNASNFKAALKKKK